MGDSGDTTRHGSVPPSRGERAPERQTLDSQPVRASSAAPAPPGPEFLSLTYTLPYHLVQQVTQLAQDTNRSQSEILAESIRLYLKAWAARQERTRISTFEGFSYQEVAVADATVEDSPSVPPEPAARGATGQAPVVENPIEAAAEVSGSGEPDPATLRRTTTDTEGPGTASDAAAPVAESATQPDDDGTDRAVQEIADPAADVRRRLLQMAREPLDSGRLTRGIEQVMHDVDTKDFSPPEHSTKVAEMARDLAAAKGFRGNRLHEVYVAGLVHDIGKACIPDEIIKKSKPSPEEMALIRKYPDFGVDLLRGIDSMEPILPLVAAHQERWNGSGYPNGLQGDDIPIAAQIVALCDVFDVLITERRYRPAYSPERARQIIQQNVGTLWNPEIARVFLTRIVGDDQRASASRKR